MPLKHVPRERKELIRNLTGYGELKIRLMGGWTRRDACDETGRHLVQFVALRWMEENELETRDHERRIIALEQVTVLQDCLIIW